MIKVDGHLQFYLPGDPRFPALADDTILNPTLDWRIHADKAAKSLPNSATSPAA